MDEKFLFDVFLLHHSKDKAIARDIAQRLQLDGLRVWFEDWETSPHDDITAKIEEGLEQSRVLVFCISGNAEGSDWNRLESYTFRFREPLNKDRRFIPLLIDHKVISKDLLRPFSTIVWYYKQQEAYVKLLDLCRRLSGKKKDKNNAPRPHLKTHTFSLGHTQDVRAVAFSPDGKLAASCSHDLTVRIWKISTGQCLRVMEGHTSIIVDVAWSPNQQLIASASTDSTIRLWDVHTGQCLQVLKGHYNSVMVVAFSPDGAFVLSGSSDKAIRIWDVHTGKCLHKWKEHNNSISSIAWSPDGAHILSGSYDKTIRLWKADTGQCIQVLRGHAGSVMSLSWSSDGKLALSASYDDTIRLWNVHSGTCIRILKGHKERILRVSFTKDDAQAFSSSADQTLRFWDLSSGQCLRIIETPDYIRDVKLKRDGTLALISSENVVELWNLHTGKQVRKMKGHSDEITCVAWSNNGIYALSSSFDRTIQLWETKTGRCLCVFNKHTDTVTSIAWNNDGKYALSGSFDRSIRLWEIGSGKCIGVMKKHTGSVLSVAWSPNKIWALSGSTDKTLRLWEVYTGKSLRIMEGHADSVLSVAFSPNGVYALSGSKDHTIRIWEVNTGTCLRMMEGHTDSVLSVTFSPNGDYVLSGSADNTIRLWDVTSGKCLRIMEGHIDSVRSVVWSPGGTYALSGSRDKTMRLWEISSGKCLQIIEENTEPIINVAWNKNHPIVYSAANNGVAAVWNFSALISESVLAANIPAQIQYCNAKVLLVGDSGVGKTGLSRYLALNIKDTGTNTSTDGVWATQWTIQHNLNEDGVEREIWLWDFAGQVDYRLVHQLYMEDTAAAVLVFNPQQENPFEGLGHWDNDLKNTSRTPFACLLVAGRIDRGGLIVSQSSMDSFIKERNFTSLHLTSAKTGAGCDELREAIIQAIDWQHIPTTTSPVLYHHMKQEILKLRDNGQVLIRLTELKEKLESVLPDEPFTLEELMGVIRLLDGPGMIQQLAFGQFILLQPEILSRYAAAVIRKVRQHSQELGCISEDDMLQGNLDYQDFKRLPDKDEKIVLRALHEKLVTRAWCLRQPGDSGVLLIFPSYFRRQRPDQSYRPGIMVTYRFVGPVDEIYATLVVRLHHTTAFETKQLWKDAADFTTQTGKELGFKLTREAEGAARLEVYFKDTVDNDTRLIFLRYIHNHLNERSKDVKRLRNYYCTKNTCGRPFTDRELIDEALLPGNKGIVYCPKCSSSIHLWDVIEQKFDSSDIKEKTHEEEEVSQSKLDNESLESILNGNVQSTIGEAGQIYRPVFQSDHGIDGEIEFKDDKGRATGQRLYLQLKSGASYLRTRQRDGSMVFQIKEARWAEYWQKHAYPVMLVIRRSKGDIRWMDVREYLRNEAARSNKPIRQIIFTGDPFDVSSILRWRRKMLNKEQDV